MSALKLVGSSGRREAVFAALIATVGLFSCGGDGGTVNVSGLAPSNVISLVPSRTSGVAPLAVFFDATGTTRSSTFRPFHDVEYRWNFDDPAGGNWQPTDGSGTGHSRNSATGPVAAHVFQTPGTYNVSLTVVDGLGTATASVRIDVTNPDAVFAGTNTLCVGVAALPVAGGLDGCPSGASVLQSPDFAAAINNNIATRKRILFKRGETFTAGSAAVVDADGPGIIGAWGSGAAPRVENAGGGDTITLSNRDTPTIRDWRIMDLEIDGNSGAATNGVNAVGGINQVTLLRLNIHHVHRAFGFSPFILDSLGHPFWDQLAIVDSTASTIIGGSGGNGGYIGAQRFSFMGNTIDDSTQAEHILRLNHVYKGLISHNILSNPAPTKGVIKLQAHPFNVAPTGFTELVVISDNKFTTGAAAPWNVNMGPQDGVSNETVKNVIVERNWFAPHPGQEIALMIFARDVTVRNNIFNLTGSADYIGVMVDRWGIEPETANVHVYDNTFYSNSTGSFRAILFQIGSSHVARNNLGYAPNSTSRTMVGGTATVSNNTSNANILTSPNFASGTPSIPAHFSLAAGSYAINAGTVVPVYSDFFRLSRPQGGAIDLGAAERP